MACSKCGHTKSSPCACHDHGLTTPCSYTNCDDRTNFNICEEVFCYECVKDCTITTDDKFYTVWDAENTNVSSPTNSAPGLNVLHGENIVGILQKMALMTMETSNAANINRLNVSPVTIGDVTTTSATISWKYQPYTFFPITQIEIFQSSYSGTTWSSIATLNAGLAGITSYNITGLAPGIGYKFKLVITDPNGSANSVAVFVNTPTS